MSRPVYPRELVAEHLAVTPRLLIRYESAGLIRAVPDDLGGMGYGPAEVRRLWSIVTLQRDLGVNLAGVEAILRLRDQVDRLHRGLASLLLELEEHASGPDESTIDET